MLGSLPKGTPILAGLGLALLTVSTALYWFAERFMKVATPQTAVYSTWAAYLYFLLVGISVFVVAVDFRRMVVARIGRIRESGVAAISPGWLIPYVLSQKKYTRVFGCAAVLYGVIYAVITSMVVYQPGVDFATVYAATFPSSNVAACCGPALFYPIVTVYVVNHLGLLFVPLTVLLLVTVSSLVGLNFALAAFAYDSRTRGVGKSWLGGLGAVVGLFTGCPTCAGLFFANFLGGSGAVALATGLGYYQPVFILLSLPVLVLAPYLVSRSLSKVFRDGCVVMPTSVTQPSRSSRPESQT